MLDPKPSVFIEEKESVLSARFPTERSAAPVLAACLFVYVIYLIGRTVCSITSENWGNGHLAWWRWTLLALLVMLVFAALARIAWGCILAIGSDHEILQVTSKQLSLTRVIFGKPRQSLSFDVSAIVNMRFAEVGIGKYGSIFGFRFEY